MFQDFRRRTTPETGPARLALLRAEMERSGVDAFLVPRSDAHQGENVAPRDERLAWLSGFTGSAGFALVTRGRAAIFVDGRYTLQVRDQVDAGGFEVMRHPEDKPADWLIGALSEGDRLAFDPWLHTVDEIGKLEAGLGPRRISLVRSENLIDRVWADQPAPPTAPILAHPVGLAGRTSAMKRADLARELVKQELAAVVLTLPDSIAWLLNVRGGDIARTPVPLAFAILSASGAVTLFVDPAQCDAALAAHLGPEVTVAGREAFGAALDALAGRVGIDKASAPVWVSDRITAAGRAEIVWQRDPCVLPKACKTEAEIAGARAAHLRDGAAMVNFLAWLDGAAPSGRLTEIDVVTRLEEFRAATGALRDISFETICGAGPNGAIVHYRVTEASNRRVEPGEVLLVDSGAQYVEGTTDVTRTVAVGMARPDAVRPFTLVLKGLIALSRVCWPNRLAGRDLDALARVAMWRAGLDYDHGTGHGIGSYLGVHEGPQRLSAQGMEPIRPGMMLSVEPGYYREGAFGIRIENLVVTRQPGIPEGGEREMLGFETLTLVPIDRRLIDVSLLDRDECDWLDSYHARVLESLRSAVAPDAVGWLEAACAPIRAG